jgi:acid stress-induced BolA-like protein IbaG/YrbA
MADGYHWLLVEVGNSRNKRTMNRDQLINAGLGHIANQNAINRHALKAAIGKKAIARYLEDAVMLQQAIEAQRQALGVRVNRNSFEVRV